MTRSLLLPAAGFCLAGILFLAGCRPPALPAPEPVTPTATTSAPTAVLDEPAPTAVPATFTPSAPAAPETPSPEPAEAAPTASLAPTASPTAAPTAIPLTCTLTPEDMLGPFYVPGAPVRDSVGEGYVLSGVVRSLAGCAPLAGAQIEFWMAGPDGEYTDDYRATMLADADGAYVFTSHLPPPYSGRPSHIHLRISSPGHSILVTQHYPEPGATAAVFDIVLAPGS